MRLNESIIEDAVLIMPAATLTQPLPRGEEMELGYAVRHGLYPFPILTPLRHSAPVELPKLLSGELSVSKVEKEVLE